MEEKVEYSWKYIVLLILVAYIFSFAIKMICLYQFSRSPEFIWNNQLMINTNDGYFFASMIQNILDAMHKFSLIVLNGLEHSVTVFSIIAFKITSFSLETILLYMPSVISNLVVIPIILIGKLYNNLSLGFFSALMGSYLYYIYENYDKKLFEVVGLNPYSKIYRLKI